ncbi:MAG: zinc ABC transporter substrate-binding protein, partial [Agathobacter sp.]|nr:zinc ABC transporter substrate-binding protein [Agathobacter sp.]
MRNKYVFVAVMLALILILGLGVAAISVNENNSIENEEDFVVVTSFYPMYIAAMNVIGDAPGVTLKNLSEPQTGCLHDFTLTPEDMKLLSNADVFIINGGGIESFMEEIAEAYPNLVIIEASEGITLLESEMGEEHDHEEQQGHEEEDASLDYDGHHHD